MKKLKGNPVIFSLLSALFYTALSGCSSLPGFESTLYPIAPKTPYQKKPNQAVVILGDTTSYRWLEIYSKNVRYDMKDVSEYVVMLPVDVGTAFSVVALNGEYRNKFGRNDDKEGHKLLITKPGIYYFGTLQTKYVGDNMNQIRLYYDPKPDPKYIKMARERYPSVFSALEPVNFH
jgi:hypothetical protein